MDESDIARELGSLDSRLDAQEDRLDRIDANVARLVEYAAQTKGGWWALTVVGAVAGAIGAFLVKFFATFKTGG